ncbi:MAG TPA: tetratricopeptide repeat protein [Kofleriaceae bacterium]|nr:tetratricopeptide repeat protein [Kofleriaceae bacterium]
MLRAALVSILLTVTAYAQSPDAKAHARRGVALYNLAKYEEAIAAFEQAYTLFQSDALLFNLAQAHRQLGHCEIAVGYYKRFMAGSPAPTLAAQVETLLPKLETACRAKDERPAGPVSTHEPAAPPSPAVATAAPSDGADEREVDAAPTPTPPRIRAFAGVTAGSVISNKTAPIAGIKAAIATPLPWYEAADIGVAVTTARLFRTVAMRQAVISSVALAARLHVEQPWARLTIGGELGALHISSLDTSSGVVPGVGRAGLWALVARGEAGAERVLTGGVALRVAVAAALTPRSGAMLAAMTEIDLVVSVRYER